MTREGLIKITFLSMCFSTVFVAWLLTDLFCWFAWATRSGFGSLKLGTSEYTMQNLGRQNVVNLKDA